MTNPGPSSRGLADITLEEASRLADAYLRDLPWTLDAGMALTRRLELHKAVTAAFLMVSAAHRALLVAQEARSATRMFSAARRAAKDREQAAMYQLVEAEAALLAFKNPVFTTVLRSIWG